MTQRWPRAGWLLALVLVTPLAAGCLGGDGGQDRGPAAPGDRLPPTLDGASVTDATLVSSTPEERTWRWEAVLEEQRIRGGDVNVMPGAPATTEITLPLDVYFGVELRIESEAPVYALLTDGHGSSWCRVSEGTFEACKPMTRLHDAAHAQGLLVVRPADTLLDRAPFAVEVRFQLTEPLDEGLPALPEPSEGPDLAPAFHPAVPVAPKVGMHEPSIAIADDGMLYVAGYTDLPGTLWRSSDGGVSFEELRVTEVAYCNNAVDGLAVPGIGLLEPPAGAFHWGCGDVDLATGAGGTVYFAHHWNGEAVHASHDAGATWTTQLAAGNEARFTDRAWLAAAPDQTNAWLAFNSGRRATPSGIVVGDTVVSRTVDGGINWVQVGQITQSTCLPGGFTHDPVTGNLYLGGCDASGPTIAISADQGITWDWVAIAERSGGDGYGLCYVCGIFTVVDTDTEGNVYAIWADPSRDGLLDVWYATSTDEGRTWTDAVRVNGADGAHLLPWLAVGEPGHAVVTWYASRHRGDPAEATHAVWYAHAAETTDGLEAAPTFHEGLISETPVQYGPVCLHGSGCEGGRNLGDYFQVALNGEGRPVVAFTDGRMGGTWTTASRVLVAVGE